MAMWVPQGAPFVKIQEPHAFAIYSKNPLYTRFSLVKSNNTHTS